MARTYDDFVLDISPSESYGYMVRVVKSSAGECVAPYQFPFDRSALEVRLKDLQIAVLRSGGSRRKALLPAEQTVQDFGAALYDSLFTGEVRSLYEASLRTAVDQGNGLRLRLRIQSPDLASLPWEYIYDGRRGDYVALAADIPIVRHLPLTGAAEPLAIRPPLRILGVIASPSNLPPIDVRAEKATIERALGGLVRKGLVELRWVDGQGWRDLRQAIRSEPWHVLHFTGHGGFDALAKEGVVYFTGDGGQSDALSATELNRLLAGNQQLRLVLLNACEGAASDETDIFSSSAATLVRGGVPAVVAMQYEITDTAATEFARTFYEALIDGLPVDTAVDEARRAISVSIPNSLEWGIPVLFMRSADGHIFDVDVKSLGTPPPPPAVESEPAPLDVPVAPSADTPGRTLIVPLPVAPTQDNTRGAERDEAAIKSLAETATEVTAASVSESESHAAQKALIAAPEFAGTETSSAADTHSAASSAPTQAAPASMKLQPDARHGSPLWLWVVLGVGVLAVAGVLWGLRQAWFGPSPTPAPTPAIAASPTPAPAIAATATPDTSAAVEPSPTPVAEETVDSAALDSDGDGLSDDEEKNEIGTDPNRADSDGDGVKDGYEVDIGMGPLSQDSDGDGLFDGEEVNIIGSNPTSVDTDSDGIRDNVELNELATDPNNSDSDGDGLLDGREVNTFKTDPARPDSDEDSIRDGDEVFNTKTDPLKADTDDDGLNDAEERDTYGSDSLNPDTDGDGLSDGDDVAAGWSPTERDTDGDGTPDGR